MGFLSVLKAIGKGIASVAGLAPLVQGVTQAIAPQAVPFEAELFKIVGITERAFEAMGQGSNGAAKAGAALPLVIEAIKASNLLAGHQLANPEAIGVAAQHFIDGTVALLNAIEHKN